MWDGIFAGTFSGEIDEWDKYIEDLKKFKESKKTICITLYLFKSLSISYTNQICFELRSPFKVGSTRMIEAKLKCPNYQYK